MTSVRLDRITKVFGSTQVLRNISLDIRAGELFFLLGPSGCGKSTLLRLIAGLHAPSSGRILFNENDVTDLPTEKRNAVMCFQSYALWPHMTVRDNVRFGLSVRHVDKRSQEERIGRVLKLVQMEKLADRKPSQLSGGQQQRVALARALAVEPACLLLDEPLSNLDAKLRHEMRSEIRRICKSAGFTTIYVTHDQKEALSVGDRIAILKDGVLQQVGTPSELYHKPTSPFVADFIGNTNLIAGKIIERTPGTLKIETRAGTIHASANGELPDKVVVSIRPEQIRVVRSSSGGGSSVGMPNANRFVGKSVETTFLGEASEHVLDVQGERIKVISAPPLFDVPPEMAVEFGPADVVVLPE